MNSSLPKYFGVSPLLHQYLLRLRRLQFPWPSLLCLMLVGALLPTLSACIGGNHLLRIGTTAGVVSDPIYLAQELGYYPENLVRLIDYPTADDQLRAFRNHQVDVTAVPLSDAILLAQTNPDLRGILVLSSSKGEDALVANRSITQLSDLAGQNVGIEASSRSRLMLSQALERARLSSQDIQLVQLSLAEQIAAFEQGEVAAVATHEPVRTSLLAAGGHYVFPQATVEQEMFNILLVNANVLQHRRRELVKLSQGILFAREHASRNSAEVSERLGKRHQLSPELMEKVIQMSPTFNLAENQRLLQPNNQALKRQVRLIGQQLKQQQLLNGFAKPKIAWDSGIVDQLKG